MLSGLVFATTAENSSVVLRPTRRRSKAIYSVLGAGTMKYSTVVNCMYLRRLDNVNGEVLFALSFSSTSNSINNGF